MAVDFYNDPNLPDIIELKGITQKYDDGKEIIKDLNLLIEDKEGYLEIYLSVYSS